MTTTFTHTLTVTDIGPIQVSVNDLGGDQPFLLLHGGAGPQSVSAFGDLLTQTHAGRIITPSHPGFGGTPRPNALNTIAGLAQLYVALLDQLDLTDVTVIGNSMGGWIAAEMALLGSPRISSLVLIDAVGIEVPGHPVADFFSLTMDEMLLLTFHNPAPFRLDLATLPPVVQKVMAGNRDALYIYSATFPTSLPNLLDRLDAVTVPTLVLWGESDRVADSTYGRAYADAIPNARFQLLPGTGHVPQLETPEQVVSAVWDFAGSNSAGTVSA